MHLLEHSCSQRLVDDIPRVAGAVFSALSDIGKKGNSHLSLVVADFSAAVVLDNGGQLRGSKRAVCDTGRKLVVPDTVVT